MKEDIVIKIEGTLGRVFFPRGGVKKVESGEFAIFYIEIDKWIEGKGLVDEKFNIKLKGRVCALEPGVVYSVTAKLSEVNEQWGNTYEIVFINRKASFTTIENQRQFIESIVTPKIADSLFKTLGDKVIATLEAEDVERLCKVKGVGVVVASKLIQTYKDSKDYSDIYSQLGDLDLTPLMIKRLVEHYNSPELVIDIVKSNPYDLVAVDGIGFKKADEIAMKVGVDRNSPYRIKGYIINLLEIKAEEGCSYLTFGQLMNNMQVDLGEVGQSVFNTVADDLIRDSIVMVTHEGNRIGLMKYFNLERKIAQEIIRIRDSEPLGYKINKWEKVIKALEERQGWCYTEEQKEGVYRALVENVVIVTAKAGAGKTTIANGMCEVLDKYQIIQCALSGKASVRMVEATGREAGTIHRTLGFSPMEGFEYNKEHQFSPGIFILDETTMVNGTIFYAFVSSIPNGSKLIMLGDVAQLTSIGNCNVFGDLIESGKIPVVRLKQIHRQGAESGVLSTSLKVSDQQHIVPSDNFEGELYYGKHNDMRIIGRKESDGLSDLIIQCFLERYAQYGEDINKVQVIVPLRKRGELCTYKLNNRIQALVNNVDNLTEGEFLSCSLGKDMPFKIAVGDKVLNVKNNYNALNEEGKKVAIFNGSVGTVMEVWDNGCIVDFIGIDTVVLDKNGVNNLELAYAMTVHKLQGSQADCCVVGVDFSAYMLLNCELLYTAISRAKINVDLVGMSKAIRHATTNVEGKKKQTYLQDILEYLVLDYEEEVESDVDSDSNK